MWIWRKFHSKPYKAELYFCPFHPLQTWSNEGYFLIVYHTTLFDFICSLKKLRWNRNGLRAYWESCGKISLKSVARTLSSPSLARNRPCVSCQTQIKREKCAESIVSDKLIRYVNTIMLILFLELQDKVVCKWCF